MNTKTTERVLIAILNGKGGVGKTLIAAIIAEWLGFQLLLHTLLDCDDNLSLTRLLPDAKRHDLKPSDGIESLIAKILESEVTLADTPANISTELVSLFSSVDFGPSLEAVNGRLVVVVPVVANDAPCADEVRKMVAAMKQGATYIIARNELQGSDFAPFDITATGQYLQATGAASLTIPRLDPNLQHLLNADRMTMSQFVGRFWALHKTDPRAAFRQVVAAQVATKHIQNIFASLNGMAAALLPTATGPKIQEATPEAVKKFCCEAWAAKQKATK